MVAPPILLRTIKELIAKGDRAKERSENFYISAGLHLRNLKENHATDWAEWEEILRVRLHISTGRASELMQLADGRKSLQEIREEKAQSMARLRARISSPRGEDIESPDEHALLPLGPPASGSNGDAHRLIDALVASSSGTRAAAAHLLIAGPRASQFESATNAVADLYQTLATAGR
jgi:hypothetical protein